MIDTNISGEDIHHDVVDDFIDFFNTYYRDEIATAVNEGRDSITVDFTDIVQFDVDIADDLVDNPELVLGHMELALEEIEIDAIIDSPSDMMVRVENADQTTHVSELRSEHREKYIGVKGQVNQITQVQPRATKITFRCERCSTDGFDYDVGPVPQPRDEMQQPWECPGCERQGPFTILEQETIDHQIIELADEPGKNLGANQHTVPVHIYGDITGDPKPGDRIQVNGLVTTEEEKLQGGTASTRRPWVIEGRAIDPEQIAFEEVTPEREDDILSLAEEPNTLKKLRDSIAPSLITGERGDQAKLAVLLQMAGGVKRNGREDIHVFLIGDKGTGKSQLLKRANELAPKSVKVSGKGATAAGLTATATQSDYGDGWMLDAGALVLADGGLACIDEFDKMNDSARKSMHEAMEDQEVPINKAGINTVLQTETAVLAAANPATGTFDRYTDLREQINLESPLISRFDLIFAVIDELDEERDRQIARHQHTPESYDQPVDDDLIKQYIAYARNNYDPEYADESVKERLIEFYVEMRQEAGNDDGNSSAFGPRMNDALRRLSEASARLRLSDTITEEDVDRAIGLMNRHIGDTTLDTSGELRTDKPGHGESPKKRVMDALDTKQWHYPAQIAQKTRLSEEKVRELLDMLMNETNPPKVEEKNGKWRLA